MARLRSAIATTPVQTMIANGEVVPRYECNWQCRCGRRWKTVKVRSPGSVLGVVVETIRLRVCEECAGHPEMRSTVMLLSKALPLMQEILKKEGDMPMRLPMDIKSGEFTDITTLNIHTDGKGAKKTKELRLDH